MASDIVTLDIEYYVDTERDARIEAAARWVAHKYDLTSLTVSVSIVDDPTIRELNAEQLGHDWATDVVSFVIERTGDDVDGEVVASWDTASRLAAKAGWTPENELLLYVVHGMLHVAGLDDIEDDDRREMREAEQECLLSLGIEDARQLPQRWNSVSY
ncbi:MAG: hypothetical protein Aurels2KO_45320 [Aureliella sp.]